MWERIGELLAVNFSWVIAVLVAMIGVGLMGALGESASADKSPVALPPGAESAKVAALLKDFPGGDQAPVILVATRSDGGDLSPADLGAAEAARARMLTIAGSAGSAGGPAIPVVPSTDGKAALAPVPLDSTLTGFALSDKVKALREAARDGLPSDLVVNVTGGPAFGADIANAFSGANVTLLAVTGAVVALLLIVTYRSPVLWLVPLLVIAFADRVAAVLGSGIAEATGMTADGSTSGITSVLVFGAGTNYALLLISRYREELRRTSHHRQALQTAVRHAGPAIVASNATVVLALLTLLFASSPAPEAWVCRQPPGCWWRRSSCCWRCRRCWRCSAGSCSGPSSPGPAPTTSPTPAPGTGSPTGCPGTPPGWPWRRSPCSPCWPPAYWQLRWVSTRSTSSGECRLGHRIQDAFGALPQRTDRPHPRHR